ncbi:hypothetical protein [Amycolatopsis sp. NPDC049868]|uniref:hypothetical protein n=1 Tax=Amycolatopsis sp. NPDC049868 TaxID=3363934 RepID=UPI003796A42A
MKILKRLIALVVATVSVPVLLAAPAHAVRMDVWDGFENNPQRNWQIIDWGGGRAGFDTGFGRGGSSNGWLNAGPPAMFAAMDIKVPVNTPAGAHCVVEIYAFALNPDTRKLMFILSSDGQTVQNPTLDISGAGYSAVGFQFINSGAHTLDLAIYLPGNNRDQWARLDDLTISCFW